MGKKREVKILNGNWSGSVCLKVFLFYLRLTKEHLNLVVVEGEEVWVGIEKGGCQFKDEAEGRGIQQVSR